MSPPYTTLDNNSGKPTLLLTRDAAHIPFDLQHYPHIVYQGKLATLLTEVEKRVRWHLDNPQQKLEADVDLIVQVNACSLEDSQTVEVSAIPGFFSFSLKLDINNSSHRIIQSIRYTVGLLTPKDIVRSSIIHSIISRNHTCNVVSYSDDQNLHLMERRVTLLPGEWQTTTFQLHRADRQIEIGELIPLVVRIFVESDPKDFPFMVRLVDA